MQSRTWLVVAALSSVVLLAACPAPTDPDNDAGGPDPSDGGQGGGGGGGGGSTDAGADGGTGASTTQNVCPTGGTVTLEGVTLSVPAGALAACQDITITSTTGPAPTGYRAYSPVYQFEPDGLVFSKPATLGMAFSGDAQLAALFWTAQGSSDLQRLLGSTTGTTLTAQVTHFSSGFVGNGVDYVDPPGASCRPTGCTSSPCWCSTSAARRRRWFRSSSRGPRPSSPSSRWRTASPCPSASRSSPESPPCRSGRRRRWTRPGCSPSWTRWRPTRRPTRPRRTCTARW